jgi:hypothetical protein
MSPTQRKRVWERLGMEYQEKALITFAMIEAAPDTVQDQFIEGILEILRANNVSIRGLIQ